MLSGMRFVVTGCLVGLSFSPVFAQVKQDADARLTPEQQKALKQLQTSFEYRPTNPTTNAAGLKDAQNNFRSLLSLTNKPSAPTSDRLATTLFQEVNGGRISVGQSVQLSKELSIYLTKSEITYKDVNRFAFILDPLVQGTSLSATEKLRLYREAVMILKTAPTYVPNR